LRRRRLLGSIVSIWTPVVDLAGSLLGASACSVALLDGDELHYVAASGAGAAEVIGLRLDLGRGIAGFVAASGQALEVDQVTSDPRFARDVAERIGYVPTALLATPMVTPDGDVVGVLSVLDRERDRLPGAEAMRLASQLADVAAVVALRAASADADLRAALSDRIGSSGRPAAEQQLLQGLAGVLVDHLDGPDPVP
jgi:signal transduction protein with GAF and PtsI domain